MAGAIIGQPSVHVPQVRWYKPPRRRGYRMPIVPYVMYKPPDVPILGCSHTVWPILGVQATGGPFAGI